MKINQAKDLLQRYQAGDCTSSEKDMIERWYRELIETHDLPMGEDEKKLIQKTLEDRIMKVVHESSGETSSRFTIGSNRGWWAAASIVLLIGVSCYFIFFNNTKKAATNLAINDIKAPQSNRAMITLANGQKVYLDSAGNGSLAVQSNVNLVKRSGGEIAYQEGAGDTNGRLEYNTLSNPRGSKVINLTFADGSKVWLNAASSLTYPVSFVGDERKVSVTGEAYFEVKHDASKPFIVNNGSMNVRVMGTHFNVNGFEDDKNIRVTLLEGSVKVNLGYKIGVLKPGQQALVNDEVKILNEVDTEGVMAWKNGYFEFNNSSLENVLKQVSRWYDVEVVYQGIIEPREFVGEMQRDLSLSEILKILEKNKVHFKVEGKKLIVLPG